METQNQVYREQFKGVTVTFSAYALKKIGIQQSNTSLKIDVYNLMCIPYQISMDSIVLLLALSSDEVVFFQRFKGCMAGLTTIIQPANALNPLKLFARCSVTSIAPVKGKPNVALVSLDFKPCPDDLAMIIGDYLTAQDRLQMEYESNKGRIVAISPESAKELGYNNYAVFSCKGANHRLALFSIATDSAQMLFPAATPDFEIGAECSLKLFFRSYQFSVSGKIESNQRMPTGVLKAGMSLKFSPELVEILSAHHGNSLLKVSKAG